MTIDASKKEEVRAALEALREKNGTLRPEDVVKEARNPKSPLHELFEWDAKKAAHAHWLDKAREIIASVRVEIVVSQRRIAAPYYVRDPRLDSSEQGYTALPVAQSNAELAHQIMSAELGRIESAIERARNICDAIGLSQEIDYMAEAAAAARNALRQKAA